MIPTATLQDWKRLLAKAAPPPVIVAAMDQKGTKFQLQTPRPIAKIVGTVFDRANADFLAACYLAMPLLLAEVERLKLIERKWIDAEAEEGPIMEKGLSPHYRKAMTAKKAGSAK